jgi:hypothetical protein
MEELKPDQTQKSEGFSSSSSADLIFSPDRSIDRLTTDSVCVFRLPKIAHKMEAPNPFHARHSNFWLFTKMPPLKAKRREGILLLSGIFY